MFKKSEIGLITFKLNENKNIFYCNQKHMNFYTWPLFS